jgi:hypothetical protein
MFLGKHPFQVKNKKFNMKKQLEGKYDKVETGKFSDELIKLMERMMNVVCVCVYMYECICFYVWVYMFVFLNIDFCYIVFIIMYVYYTNK